MKKNKMMRLASFLLIAVLVSTSAISGTYAKYVSSATADDTARVAKWGVTVTADGDGSLFANSYDETGSVTVEAATDVVAPGTGGSLVDFTVAGDPEVDVKVTFVATVTMNGTWAADSVYYCPLVVTVNGTEVKGWESSDAADFAADVKAAIDAVYASYSTEETISASVLNVSWSWAYNGDGIDQTDGKDTQLGDLIADADDANDPGITVSVECFVTQID